MHKVFGLIAIMGLIAAVVSAKDATGRELSGGFDEIDAREMTAAEMDETDGALFARGARRRNRVRRFSWRNTAAREDRVHCDILARNRAESMGYDTSTPRGAFNDYNAVTVGQIYGDHRSNRYSTPPRGTAGYIFTGGTDGKTHLQFYDNRSGGNSYTRYSNRSYPGTESINVVRADYMPGSASRQVFVPLPRRDPRTVWSW